MTLPSARIVHAIPGRMRVQVPSRRGDWLYFARTSEQLRSMAEVQSLDYNPRTGSLLIRHRSDPRTIAGFARENGLFELNPNHAAGTEASGKRRSAVGPLAPPLGIAAVTFGTLSAYQAIRGRLAGNATETFWTAYNARTVLGQPWLAALLAGFGVYNLGAGRILSSAPSLLYYGASAWNLMKRRQSETPDA